MAVRKKSGSRGSKQQTHREDPYIGVDIGTSRIVVSMPTTSNDAESELNAFFTIPYNKLSEQILNQNDIQFMLEDNKLIIYGYDSDRFASIFNAELKRPMRQGVLNSGEPEAIKMIQAILKSMVDRAPKLATPLAFSIPAANQVKNNLGVHPDWDILYHEKTLANFFTSLGYDARSVNEGLCVILSELEKNDYTGVGISVGAGMCNVCFSYLSVVVLSFSLPIGGDFIDQMVSQSLSTPQNRIRSIKEESFDLTKNTKQRDDFSVSAALSIYYEKLVTSIVDSLYNEITHSSKLPKIEDAERIPIVLSGGTVKPKGFLQLFEKALSKKNFPFNFGKISIAKDPLAATAYGAAVAAKM